MMVFTTLPTTVSMRVSAMALPIISDPDMIAAAKRRIHCNLGHVTPLGFGLSLLSFAVLSGQAVKR
jgi:hypothetical protein